MTVKHLLLDGSNAYGFEALDQLLKDGYRILISSNEGDSRISAFLHKDDRPTKYHVVSIVIVSPYPEAASRAMATMNKVSRMVQEGFSLITSQSTSDGTETYLILLFEERLNHAVDERQDSGPN